MENIIDWAYDEAATYLPDLEANGPVSAEDLVNLLRNRYYDMFSEPTTKEVREVLLLVAKEFV